MKDDLLIRIFNRSHMLKRAMESMTQAKIQQSQCLRLIMVNNNSAD